AVCGGRRAGRRYRWRGRRARGNGGGRRGHGGSRLHGRRGTVAGGRVATRLRLRTSPTTKDTTHGAPPACSGVPERETVCRLRRTIACALAGLTGRGQRADTRVC